MRSDEAKRQLTPSDAPDARGASRANGAGGASPARQPDPVAAQQCGSALAPERGSTPSRPAGAKRPALLAIGIGVGVGLAGVFGWWALSSPVNDRVASLCRSVIPAINPKGTGFTIGAPRLAAFGDGLRIPYISHFSDGRVRAREVACRYAISSADDTIVRITGVATERGPLNDANFYFLRRFYLEASDGPPADPAGSQATAPQR